MADTIIYAPFFQGEDANGNPLAGAKLYFYLANTTTKITIYQDALAATPHQNPVVADATGMFAPIFLADGQAPYKTELTTSAGSVIQTVDGIVAVQRYSATFADIIARWTPASASGPASLDFREDADNGTSRVRVIAPSALAADYSFVLPAANVTLDSFIVTLLNSTTLAGAQAAIGVREVLAANRTYYVRTDGSDSNNGLADTSGGAFLTIAKALSVAAALDCSIYNLTIQVRTGTFTGAVALPMMIGSGTFTLLGDSTTPANCLISRTSADAISANNCGSWAINGFKLATTTSGIGLRAIGARTSLTLANMDFGTVAGAHHILAEQDARVFANATAIKISGGTAYACWGVGSGGVLQAYSTAITVTASFTITRFVDAGTWGLVDTGSLTFSLGAFTITGQRYNANATGGGINTGGGGASYFPGTTSGAATSPGWYA